MGQAIEVLDIFEIGKYYRHTSGKMMHILCEAETTLYGKTLLAETFGQGEYFRAVGKGKSYCINFVEISKDEWAEGLSQRTDEGKYIGLQDRPELDSK